MKYNGRARLPVVTAVVVLGAVCLGILFIETQTKIIRLSWISRDRYPDLGVRACVRTLVPPNPAHFTAEAGEPIIRRWVDNVIYDNRNHYLPCEQLSSISEVEKILEEHHDVIQQIEAINPGVVGIEVNPCGTGNADITFWYGSHQDRIVIEQIIGSDTFFGIPYNLQNR